MLFLRNRKELGNILKFFVLLLQLLHDIGNDIAIFSFFCNIYCNFAR